MRIPDALLRSRPSLLAAGCFVGAASTALAPSADGDIWWHLAAGREMVQRGWLLFTDPFSSGANGRAWPDVHWLFQLSAYAVHGAFGLAGLVWAKCLLVGLGALVLLGSFESKTGRWERPLFVTLFVAALFVARSLLLVRPVLVSLLFLALFFKALEQFRRDGRVRHLAALPLLQVVWANFQGLSALGPALVFAYALAAGLAVAGQGQRGWPFAPECSARVAPRAHVRALATAFVGCALGSLLTPFGLLGISLPAKLLRRLLPGEVDVYTHAIAENVPPFVQERLSGEFWHLKWFFAALAIAFACGGRRIRMSHVLLVSGLAVLALLSNRNVLLFYWLATPVAASYAAPVVRAWVLRKGGQGGARLAWALNGAAFVALSCVSGLAAAREPALSAPGPFRVPSESAERLASLPGGDVFAADQQGGYLIWRLFPRFRPYIDTRLVLRTAGEFEEYLRLADEPERFPAFQAQHHFSYVLLPVAYPDRYLKLIAALYASQDWKLVFSNGSEVLFARREDNSAPEWNLTDPAVTARITAGITARVAADPKRSRAAYLHLATLDLSVGEFEQAEHVLALSAGPEAEALLARCRLGSGDITGARDIGLRLLRRDRQDVSSLNLMAQVALRSGEVPQAVGFLRRALSVDPYDDEATRILANLEETQ